MTTPKPRIIAVVHSKGGVGKSTLAINLLHEIQSKGKKAILFDADPQRTAVDFAATRKQNPKLADLPIREIAPDELHKVPELAAEYDYAIIDTPGTVSRAYREAIAVADTLLMPMVPGAAEIWAFRRAFGTIKELTAKSPKLALIAYTQVPSRTSVLADLAEEQDKMTDEFNVNFLDSHITHRACWRSVFFHGNTVKDATGKLRNDKATAELAALYNELESTLSEYDVLTNH